MEIHKEDVPRLVGQFEKKYKYPLMRDELCQSHSDFFNNNNSYLKYLIMNKKKYYIDEIAKNHEETKFQTSWKDITIKIMELEDEKNLVIYLFQKVQDGR